MSTFDDVFPSTLFSLCSSQNDKSIFDADAEVEEVATGVLVTSLCCCCCCCSVVVLLLGLYYAGFQKIFFFLSFFSS